MTRRTIRAATTAAVVVALSSLAAHAAEDANAAPKLVEKEFRFTSTLDGTGPLLAKVVFPEGARHLPMMVVQHGYMGSRQHVRYSAQRMAQRGYFCVCIDTRGWGGSAGKHDDGGLEIHDILDGMDAAAAKYGDRVDANLASIIGYSNGGANVFFAAVRAPYRFRNAMAMFGIPDYRMWIDLNGAFRKHVIQAVGGEPNDLPDKYLARNAILAAGNLSSGTRFHVVYDEEEKLCPIPMDTAFLAAAREGGAKDLFLHVSKTTDEHRWFHGYNAPGGKRPDHLSPIEDVFLADIAESKARPPQMPDKGELVVIGYVVTPRFRIVLGKGDDAVAKVKYAIGPVDGTFELTPLSSDPNAAARIELIPRTAGTGAMFVDATRDKPKRIAPGQPLDYEATLSSKVRWVVTAPSAQRVDVRP